MELIGISLIILILGLAFFIPAIKRVLVDGQMRRQYRAFNEDREGKVSLEVYKMIFDHEKESSMKNRRNWEIKDGDELVEYLLKKEKKDQRNFGSSRMSKEQIKRQQDSATLIQTYSKEETKNNKKFEDFEKKVKSLKNNLQEDEEPDEEIEEMELDFFHEEYGMIQDHLNMRGLSGRMRLTASGYDFKELENFSEFLFFTIQELSSNSTIIFPVNNSWVVLTKNSERQVGFSFDKNMARGLK